MINKKTSVVSVAFALIILITFSSQLTKLKFDYELENFFPKNDPDLAYYEDFTRNFGYDNDYLLLGFQSSGKVFDSQFLNKIESDLKRAKKLKPTIEIYSPTGIKHLVKTPVGYIPIPLFHLSQPEKLKNDSIKIYKHPLFREMFLSKSGKSIKAILIHERFESKEAADEYVNEIKSILKPYGSKVHIAGKAIAQTAFVDTVKTDFALFIVLALVVVCVWLIVFMKQFKLILASLFISSLSVIATIGLMALTGKKVDVLSSLIPTILLVVSMSNIIHLFAHIQNHYQETKDLNTAVNLAIKQVGIATLLTALTTSTGFLTLIMFNVNPIIDLGVYSACGILIAFIITYLVYPSILTLTNTKPSVQPENRSISVALVWVTSTIENSRGTILIAFTIISLLSIVGLSRLEIDAFLVNDLPQNNQVRTAFMYFDREFSGSKPLTLSLWSKSPEFPIFSKEVITEIDKLEQLVRSHTHAGDLMSPVTLVKLSNQNLNKGLPKNYKLPNSTKEWKKAFQYIKGTHLESLFIPVRLESTAQMTGYFQDLGSKDATLKLSKLLKELELNINHEIIGYRITGTTPLVNKSHELLSINLIKGLLLAMGIVGIIAGWLFRSLLMTMITLIPNLLPILFVGGIMGYFGIPLNLSTSVIFAISFGIVVDDTIHFLSQFKTEYKNQKTKKEAINATIKKTGTPIIMTTIMLTSGFLVFCFSSFNAAFYMGLFVSISFTAALLADLLLLPVLILWWFPEKKK